MQDLEKIYQMLNEKLFHDFASAVCVISNSVALIKGEDNAIKDHALELIKTSSLKTINYLKFYRFIYSTACEQEMIFFSEIKYLTIDFIESRHQSIVLEFRGSLNQTISSYSAKIIMCLIVLAIDDISHDGAIVVSCSKGSGGLKISVVLDSNIPLCNKNFDILTSSTENLENLNIRNCHQYYTKHLIQKADCAVSFDCSDNRVEYIVS